MDNLALYDEKINNQWEACFLNRSKSLDFPGDWNSPVSTKLWIYNLHYFEDLLSDNFKNKREFHLELLSRWVDQNPVGCGNGWEPYPTSLRIVNILKAWLGGLEIDEKLFGSVFAQGSYLSKCLEKHLLGNHYFVNLKALLFAGVIFENPRWLSIAENGLLAEIPEQILEDGANFELSPMYHSLMLVDMLDIFNLSKAFPARVSGELVAQLVSIIPKMLDFMEVMAHPDGGVSFFNDSVDGIAPVNAKIESYAERLGFGINRLDLSKFQVIDNPHSGYICATAAGSKLMFDASAVGPDYIPGHAHADTLSFELSIGAQRVFVNSGISEYGLSPRRLIQRQTSSHNTVEVDGKDSSQVWSGFRVGQRARVIERGFEANGVKTVVRASHNGYKTISGGPIHARTITLGSNSLRIDDKLSGDFGEAVARFYFHPDLEVQLEQDLLTVSGEGFDMSAELTAGAAKISRTNWHPEFGLSQANSCLECTFTGSEQSVTFLWVKR